MSELYSAKRIGKNTLLLYVRMVIIMAVNFYTTRVLLNYLGVEDYGLYNVLMGVITMFSFISTSMTAATQRFLSYEIGTKNNEKLQKVFSASLYIYILLIIISIILFETIGLWYVYNYLNIPEDRIYAAQVVFQLVVIQYVFLTIRIPYNAAVIAHEKMDFFAYMSIIEAVLALVLIYFLGIINTDKLILYAFLLLLSRAFVTSGYYIYSKRKFRECNLIKFRKIEKSILKEIWSFSGWNIFGSFAVALNGQGINLLINYFSGVIVNASVGIATQLTSALYGVVGNLQTSFNPQLVKLYAAKEYNTFYTLLNRNCKICCFLFLLISMPLSILIKDVLDIWLDRECLYAVEICRCLLIYQTIESLAYPLTIGIQAVGIIKRYQQVSALLFVSIMPIGICLYAIGATPVMIYVAEVFINIMVLIARMWHLQKVSDFSSRNYFREVILRTITVVMLSLPIPLVVSSIIENLYVRIICVSLLSIISICMMALMLGFTKHERDSILKLIYKLRDKFLRQ